MALLLATGSPTTELTDDQLRAALEEVYEKLGPKERVFAVPPDYSRYASRAGRLTEMTWEHYGEKLIDVMPAVGTHKEMSEKQRLKMFGETPKSLFRYHNWRTDIDTVGTVPSEYVSEVTEGIYTYPWPAQLNKRINSGEHDLILSIGQVVPHEVIGMANYNKNIFVGTGGVRGINESHYIGAAYGMERIMGRGDTPLRRILNFAQDNFCQHLPLVYVLTVIGPNDQGESVVRGLFVGDDVECFERACELSREVNLEQLDKPFEKVVVNLNAEKFESTWLGNKAIYRTRMAIADGGELIILAPGVSMFGEDDDIDRLIRKYGYRTTPEILDFVAKNEVLRENLSAAAHLIHGSTENRFKVTYCTGELSQAEVESVGYEYGELREYQDRYQPTGISNGYHKTDDGEQYYYIDDPAMGLWSYEGDKS
ncbi:MAG: lactate racemase domain-containing protein [Lacipirellulaceae bacterium]